MQVANNDQEMLVMQQIQQKEEFSHKLHEFFKSLDKSGDGYLSSEEFSDALGNPEVIAYLRIIGLEVYEVTALFNLLDDGDGAISFEEFLGGAVRLKGNARSVDSVAIMHGQHKILKLLESVKKEENILRVHSAFL